MNIVDLISSQLSGDVLGKLGGLVGADATQTKTATSAAVPALLNVFSKLASSNSGADSLARAMGGLDLSTLGNLAGLLGGGQAAGLGNVGGNLLGSLLGGGNTLTTLVNAIATFAKVQPGMMKSLLTYLAPIVLGMIAKQFTGRPDAAGVSRLFSEQAANISRAVPGGLALDGVLSAIGGGGRPSQPAPAHGRSAHEPAPAGAPGWLLPLLVLAALFVGWYLWNENAKKKAVVVEERVTEDGVTVDRKEVVATDGKTVVDAVQETVDVALPDVASLGKDLTGVFGGLTEALNGVTDKASAEKALPKLEELLPVISAVQSATAKLPAEGRTAIGEIAGKQIGPLEALIDKVMAIQGVKEILGEKVTALVQLLKKFVG